MTAQVDISPGAVERYIAECGYGDDVMPFSMLRALRSALTAAEKLAEEWRWLKANPDELISAVDDAYGEWDGEIPGDFADILDDEIRHQRSKARG